MSTTSTKLVEIGSIPIEVLDLTGACGRAPLVLLHEGLGSVGLWRSFPRKLRERTGRRLIAFSRYGHGASGPAPRPRSPAFFHEEALDVLPELLAATGAQEPILVGHSDGASIALIHAAVYRVSALVLLAPHVVVEQITVNAIRQTRDAFLSGDLRDRMAARHADPDAAFWGWCDVWLDPAFRDWNLEAEAARVSAPTLLIQGADDPYGTLEQIDRIEARAGGPVERLVLPGGHSPHLEHGDDVAGAIASFVDRVVAGGPGASREALGESTRRDT
ncbi:MAG: alpha/beta fold hydrolase [Solirubrobacteraceae bacterium]